jgi:DNA-binding transcriptional LysR family regulator
MLFFYEKPLKYRKTKTMNIKTLKIFSDLVANANFSKTARQNNVSQSAISQKIRHLEERLNINLLEKNQKSFQLTEEGNVFFRHAQLIISEYESMLHDVQNYDVKTLGGLNLLTNSWLGLHIIPHYIREYFKTFKNFALDINYSNSEGLSTIHLDPKANLMILESPLPGDDFISEQFTKDEFVAVCLAESALKDQQTFALGQLKSQPLIGFTRNHPLRLIFDREAKKRINHWNYLMEFNQIELIKQAIEMYNGLAILPKSSVYLPHEEHLFHILPLKGHPIIIPIYLIYRRNRKLNRAMECFITILKGKKPF